MTTIVPSNHKDISMDKGKKYYVFAMELHLFYINPLTCILHVCIQHVNYQ